MEHKIGLVLSGGGAKGAYEVGVWHALEHLGVLPYIDCIYGTSVGALNAALLDVCGGKRAAEIWSQFKKEDFFCRGTNKDYSTNSEPDDLIQRKQQYNDVVMNYIKLNKAYDWFNLTPSLINYWLALNKSMVSMVKNDVASFNDLVGFLTYFYRKGLPITQEKISAIIKENIDFSLQKRKIVAFCMKSSKPHQVVPFDLQEIDDNSRKRNILLASSAMPFIYQGKDGIKIDGTGYFDGGTNIRIIGHGQNTPLSPMFYDGWKRIICVWLNSKVKPNPNKAADVVHIIPSSSSIGKLFNGTLKLNPIKMKNDFELGYRDTMMKETELHSLIKGLTPFAI